MGNAKEERKTSSIKDKDMPVEDQLMKPFNLGWRREVVMRVVTLNNNCDIYYLHPSGKKLRSMAEIKAHLSDGLTIDCFSFKKKPLNVGSEIVRSALVRGRPNNTKPKTIKPTNKSNIKERARRKITNQKNKEKLNNHSMAKGQRQMLMKKKERQSCILEVNNSKKSNISDKRNLRKTDVKASRTTASVKPSGSKQNKADAKKKTGRKVKLNCVQLKLVENSALPRIKLESSNTGRQRDLSDIRSIVQRNIGKYRELREKQILSKMKEDGGESQKTKISCKIFHRSKRSEPISKNLHIYLKPLERGWRREVVHRTNGPAAAGRSDVYYYHPNGKKLRSTREIANNLTQGLTIDCFTFRKEALGCGEPQEIIRNARLMPDKAYIVGNKKKIELNSSKTK